MTLLNLEPALTYHYQIRSEPPIGPATLSEDHTFTTLSLTPEIIDAKFRRITDTLAEIEWQTNLPTRSSIVYEETATGKQETIEDASFLKSHQVTLEHLTPSTNYSIRIKALDEGANASVSSVLPFSSGISLNPPLISQVRISSALIPDRVTTVQTIISWKTDKPATSRVRFGQGTAGELSGETPLESALTFDHVVITTAFRPSSVYQLVAESGDGQGRVGKSDIYLVLAPTPKRSAVDLILQNLDTTFGFINRR